MVEYCSKNSADLSSELEAKETPMNEESIEEITTVSNEIVTSKEHIINLFSKEFVENIEKAMSIRVEQLKNSNHKFIYISIPSSFEERYQENFKQMFFNTPEMSGASSHYSKNIERSAYFGETNGNIQNMQHTFQGLHKMTFMMTIESNTLSTFGNHFNTLMKNAIPAIEYKNNPVIEYQNNPVIEYQNQLASGHIRQQPQPINQLKRYHNKPVPILSQPAIITISSSDEAPPAVKLKIAPIKNNKNTDKENQCANIQKSTKIPISTKSTLDRFPKKAVKKFKRKERQRERLSESSDENDNDSLRSRRHAYFVNRQRIGDLKENKEINNGLIGKKKFKEFEIALVDCMKRKEKNLCSVNEDLLNVDEDLGNAIEDLGNVNEDLSNVNEDLSNVNEDIADVNDHDDTISTITSDDEKYFFIEKYNFLREQKRQLRLHKRCIERGLYSDYKPELFNNSIKSTTIQPLACSTLIHSPTKSKSPQIVKKSPKRKLLKNKCNISSNQNFIVVSDSDSNTSISTITSDDVKFFEKDKYDKLREEKYALRTALRAQRKKKN